MANNSNTVKFSDGREIHFSYGVPTAAFLPRDWAFGHDLPAGYVRRARKFSVTTSKHTNAFAGNDAAELSEDAFTKAVAPVEVK